MIYRWKNKVRGRKLDISSKKERCREIERGRRIDRWKKKVRCKKKEGERWIDVERKLDGKR